MPKSKGKEQGNAQAAQKNSFSFLQGPSSVNGQDIGGSQAPPEPVKVPQEPMIRDITAGLSIPAEVDELMREHIRFLYREGNALLTALLSGNSAKLFEWANIVRALLHGETCSSKYSVKDGSLATQGLMK